jgi:hypothetical protein
MLVNAPMDVPVPAVTPDILAMSEEDQSLLRYLETLPYDDDAIFLPKHAAPSLELRAFADGAYTTTDNSRRVPGQAATGATKRGLSEDRDMDSLARLRAKNRLAQAKYRGRLRV